MIMMTAIFIMMKLMKINTGDNNYDDDNAHADDYYNDVPLLLGIDALQLICSLL